MKLNYKPPYSTTTKTVNQVVKIAEQVTKMTYVNELNLRLQKTNRIKAIQGSLAIDGNTLNSKLVMAYDCFESYPYTDLSRINETN